MEPESKHINPVGILPKYFSGEASPEEISLVESWRSESSANSDEYNAILRLWNISGDASASGEIDIEKEWQKMETAIMPRIGRTFSRVRFLQLAASVILISGLALIGLKLTGVKSERAPSDNISSAVLPDGSRIFLNAGSKITYKNGFGITHRNLDMKGEAFFEVKKITGLPFHISAGNASVQVKGTKFNVKAYHGQENIQVTVTEGTVLLYDDVQPGENISLDAGQTGLYNKKYRSVSKLLTHNLNDLAWKTLIMDFHNTPLPEVADILANTYHHRVNLSPALKNCTITVHFENRKLEDILDVLRSTLNLKTEIRGKRIYISGKGC